MTAVANAATEGFPDTIGTSNDPSFAARFSAKILYVTALGIGTTISLAANSAADLWTGSNSLSEGFLTPRKHQAFRAVDHPFCFFTPPTSGFTNRCLVGRSAWNTGWKIVIPASTMLLNATTSLLRHLHKPHASEQPRAGADRCGAAPDFDG